MRAGRFLIDFQAIHAMSETDVELPGCIRTISIGDRDYHLMPRHCEKCGSDHLEVWRFSGTSFARYLFPPEFDADDFEPFVERVDEALLMTAPELMEDFHRSLSKVNSRYGIVADHSFSFRLLEYGRQRASRLQKLGMFDVLISDREPESAQEQSVRTAFELGAAVAEHRVIDCYEDYLHLGMAVSEWREDGLPKAREERLRQGKRTRAAILEAAKRLYEKNPELVRNDSETARQILKLDLPDLQKGNGTQIGFDAITRHLREARSNGQASCAVHRECGSGRLPGRPSR